MGRELDCYAKEEICFATMAVGNEYVELAKMLVLDISHHHPLVKTYVLTDSLSSFSQSENVLCVEHVNMGAWSIYHDKMQVIEYASNRARIVIFLDSDVRLLHSAPLFDFLDYERGIYAYWVQNIDSKLKGERQHDSNSIIPFRNGAVRRESLYRQACEMLEVQYESAVFVQEAIMLYVQCEPKDFYNANFFRFWNLLRNYFLVRKFEFGEGNSIGISAARCGIGIRKIEADMGWFFKDLYYHNNYSQDAIVSALRIVRQDISRKYKKTNAQKFLRFLVGAVRYVGRTVSIMNGKYKSKEKFHRRQV